MSNWTIPFTVRLDQDAPFKAQTGQGLMLPGDHQAHTIEVTVLDHEAPATLTGTPKGFFTRADGRTVVCGGTRSGNVVRVTMERECYMTGPLRCVIRLLTDVENNLGLSLVDADFYVREGIGEEIVDPDGAFPTVQAQAERLEEVENQVGALDARLDDIENAPALTSALTLAPGWSDHPDYPQPVRVVRRGYIVFLEGVVTNASAVTLDVEHTVTLATLPSWARPARAAHCLNQGTSQAVFKITAEPSGALVLSRYRMGAEWATVAANSYLCLTSCWLSSDATGSGAETVDDLEALIARMEAVATGAVRYNAGQSLTTAQQAQAWSNIGVTSAIGASAVRYDAAQSLTAAQKTRARGNIGAASTEEVATAAAGVAALETVIEHAELVSTSWTDICTIQPSGGLYYTNEAIGTTIDPTVHASANFGCQLVQVTAGERYRVRGIGANAGVLWALTDTSYVLLSKAEAVVTEQTDVVTVTTNGYMFVNARTNNATYSLEKYAAVYSIPQIKDDITSLDGRTGAVEARAANTVKYTEQTLSEAFQAQARENIGAAATADLTTLRNDFENSGIMESAWADICTITHGGGVYWTNKEIGSTISLENDFHANGSFGHQIVQVSAGDKFKVTGTGGQNPLLWAFTDTAYHLLSKATAVTGSQTAEITAPANGYLFVNAQTAQQAVYSLEQWQTVYALPEIEAHMDAIDDALYRTADKNLIGEFVFYRRFVTSGGVGSTVDMTGGYSSQYGSVVSDCKRGDVYVITGQGGNDPRLWCFVDSSNKIKSVAGMSVTATNLEITAPDDGKLIYQVSLSYPYAITKKDVTELETDARFAEEDVTLFPFTGFDMFRSIAGLGDSYTEGDLVRSGGEWTTINGISYLGSIARRNGVTANNYGSGGSTTKTYLDRQAFANCLAASPSDLYMISFGINDASGSMTVGTVSDIHDDYTQNPDTFCGNYGRIMAQLTAHAPDAKYVLIMPWPTGQDYSAYNAAVAAIAAHYGVPCIDPSDDPFFSSYFWQAYKSSGHPVAMTYAGMGRAVERLFARCVVENPTYFKYALIG